MTSIFVSSIICLSDDKDKIDMDNNYKLTLLSHNYKIILRFYLQLSKDYLHVFLSVLVLHYDIDFIKFIKLRMVLNSTTKPIAKDEEIVRVPQYTCIFACRTRYNIYIWDFSSFDPVLSYNISMFLPATI